MNARIFAVLCFSACLVAVTGSSLYAQGRNPGGPPPGPPPGAPGGHGGPGEPGGPPPPGGKQPGSSAGANGGVHFGPVGRWWDDKSIIKTVGLSSEQKKKMDAIFDANRPAILAAYRSFLKQQAKLDALSKDPKADKTQTFAAIDAVNQARDELEKATAKMYLEIRQLMTPEQIDQLQKLQ